MDGAVSSYTPAHGRAYTHVHILIIRRAQTKKRAKPLLCAHALTHIIKYLNYCRYTTPCAIIALATFMKPAMLAPFT